MTTEAGRRVAEDLFDLLVDRYAGTAKWDEQEQLRQVEADIAAIEAEARADERQRLMLDGIVPVEMMEANMAEARAAALAEEGRVCHAALVKAARLILWDVNFSEDQLFASVPAYKIFRLRAAIKEER